MRETYLSVRTRALSRSQSSYICLSVRAFTVMSASHYRIEHEKEACASGYVVINFLILQSTFDLISISTKTIECRHVVML